MKVMTILGTRPEIIRLSKVIPLLDAHCRHVLVHTGQNYDPRLNEIFFDELQVRKPDEFLGVLGTSAADQVAQIIHGTDQVMEREKPDAILILGDTNSGLSAIMAKRRGIRVFHMEAGNRCFDDRVPEEVNRRVIDHSSDILMPYTERSRGNLLAEGIPSRRIFVTGNPIFEVIESNKHRRRHMPKIEGFKGDKFALLTAHRAENVDDRETLNNILKGADEVGALLDCQVIFSLHPRTQNKMQAFGLEVPSNVLACKPFGVMDFLLLEYRAACVLTDSGTVQEECCLFQTPNVTIRDTTERPETIEVGSNIVCGTKPEDIVRAAKLAVGTKHEWQAPSGYMSKNVSTTVAKIVLGHHEGA